MDNPEYAHDIFHKHYLNVKDYIRKDYTVCELGPGDLLSTAMFASCYGATKVYLVDVDDITSKKIDKYGK